MKFLYDNLITCLGNKRKLLPFIASSVEIIIKKLGKTKITAFDGFAGSGSVARLLKQFTSDLYVNDLESYSHTLQKCYLANKSEVDYSYIKNVINYLNIEKKSYHPPGFIATHYAPKDDNSIKSGERVFYTSYNAQIIDNIRRLADNFEKKWFFIAPLLVKASIHANTSGVFKGFHKKDGIGHFGGLGENALSRIMKEITLDYPIFSDEECNVTVFQGDTNEIVKQIECDLAYYDPPYNCHPYGSNYFMLNIINDYNNPEIQDGKSGITKDWNRSRYNKKQEAEEFFDDLIANTKAKYILISYGNEGLISPERMEKILSSYGEVSFSECDYNCFRGSRNLRNRSLKVKEIIWIVKT